MIRINFDREFVVLKIGSLLSTYFDNRIEFLIIYDISYFRVCEFFAYKDYEVLFFILYLVKLCV